MVESIYPPPVNVGEVYNLLIEETGNKGDGLGSVTGYKIIIKDAKLGETVKVKITRTFRKYAFAQKIE